MADSTENILPEGEAGPHPGRRRYKYRYKRKRSRKKRLRKYLEYVLWIAIVSAFIISLIILIKQMDVSDESIKRKRKKADLSIELKTLAVCKMHSGYLISHGNII